MIAIVGNGSINGNFGDAIDSNEIVIRFNSFVTDGYEDEVGTKTTYHSMSISLLASNHKIRGKLIVPTPLSNVSKPSLRLAEKAITENDGMCIDRQYSEMASSLAGLVNRFPTSGLMVVVYFLFNRGAEISLYGFSSNSGHYWDIDEKPTGSHNFKAEMSFYQKLHKLGIVNLIE